MKALVHVVRKLCYLAILIDMSFLYNWPGQPCLNDLHCVYYVTGYYEDSPQEFSNKLAGVIHSPEP